MAICENCNKQIGMLSKYSINKKLYCYNCYMSIKQAELSNREKEQNEFPNGLTNIVNELYKPIYTLSGSMGRVISIYDDFCIIKTNVTLGSIITNNATDGEKMIFYSDIIGIQYKEPNITSGYLQLETASMTMNNNSSNHFNENTFTYEINNVSKKQLTEAIEFIIKKVANKK